MTVTLDFTDIENSLGSIGESGVKADFSVKKAVKTDIFLEFFISILAVL
jgi:hypothetical protein